MQPPMMWLDWLIVAIPLVAIVIIGFMAEHYVRNVSDFLAGGRKAGRYLLAVCDGAAGLGLITVVGNFEEKYCAGYGLDFWANLLMLVTLAMTLTGFVSYRFRETRAMTMPEFFQMRYSRGFRILAGILAFVSGLINYALFPAVGGRFMIYYCGLPFQVHCFGLTISTYGLVMAIALLIALAIVLAGGQLTTMVTDCCQGIFAYFGYAVITWTLLYIFSASDMVEAVMTRPEGESFFNPFNVGHLSSF
ncbi:MAG: sodium:solute symporter, partial [Lentisphaeria bacterium]|nr:sodium:solute symporter [Lentisphaeria bacterium]